MPVGVIWWIGVERRSTRRTFVAVVGGVVVGVEEGALGAEGVVVGEELAAGLGVFDDLADLGADEVGGGVVGGLVGHDVGE